jgi:hypothetical protein
MHLIEIVLTIFSAFDNVNEIFSTEIINVDKQSRRPSRRCRQSSKLSTAIFSVVRVEDLQPVAGK